MSEINLNSREFEAQISLKQAYLIMFHFLDTNWNGCWEEELGSILSELSLWSSIDGNKAPMDAAVLPTFLEAAEQIIADPSCSRADIQLG